MRHNVADRVNKFQDTIDSRDVVERIEELERELSAIECPECEGRGILAGPEEDETGEPVECVACDGEGKRDYSQIAPSDLDIDAEPYASNADEFEELAILRELVAQIDDTAGDKASDGVCLVRDSYFQQHAQQEAEDCCDIKAADRWPFTCIDWEQAARELQMDYSVIDYDNVIYWVRS